MNLTTEQLSFLARLAKTPDGRLLVGILQAKLVVRDTDLRKQTGEHVFRAQGRSLELAELIDDITQAEQRLTRSQATPRASRPVVSNWEPR